MALRRDTAYLYKPKPVYTGPMGFGKSVMCGLKLVEMLITSATPLECDRSKRHEPSNDPYPPTSRSKGAKAYHRRK